MSTLCQKAFKNLKHFDPYSLLLKNIKKCNVATRGGGGGIRCLHFILAAARCWQNLTHVFALVALSNSCGRMRGVMARHAALKEGEGNIQGEYFLPGGGWHRVKCYTMPGEQMLNAMPHWMLVEAASTHGGHFLPMQRPHCWGHGWNARRRDLVAVVLKI